MPDNAIARRLAKTLGNPLLSTTANWEDADPDDLANPEAIADRYGRESVITLMIDGGTAPADLDSAIVSLLDSRSPEILRPGPAEPVI